MQKYFNYENFPFPNLWYHMYVHVHVNCSQVGRYMYVSLVRSGRLAKLCVFTHVRITMHSFTPYVARSVREVRTHVTGWHLAVFHALVHVLKWSISCYTHAGL